MFRAKLGNYPSSDFSSGELKREINLPQVEVRTPKYNGAYKENMVEEGGKTPSEHGSLVGLNDAADEFFDVPEPADYDQSEIDWPSNFGPEMHYQVLVVSK